MQSANKLKNLTSPPHSLAGFLFHILYVFLNFFVIVGEYTKLVLVFPYNIIRKALLKAIDFISGPEFRLVRNGQRRAYLRLRRGAIFTRKWIKRCFIFGFRSARKSIRWSFKAVRFALMMLIRIVWELITVAADTVAGILGSIVRFILRLVTIPIRFFLLGFLVCFLVISGIQLREFVRELPSPKQIGNVNYPLTTHIYDRNGKLLYEMYHDQNRTPVQIAQIPIYVRQATIAFEDKDFYEHNGISIYSGILRAAKETLFNNRLEGGSTITQQLVKSALLTPERSIKRKVKEIILAIWTEKMFKKDQILEMYLNQVPYGGSAYGIEEAAKTYFGKSVKDLTLSEAALLAGLPQAPSIYSPFVNPELALRRRNDVLDKMEEQKYITHVQLVQAKDEKLEVKSPRTLIKAPHFVFDVKASLENTYGLRQVEEGGYQVTTTLDLPLQEEAEKILNEEINKIRGLQVTNGAILITKPATGEILAMVGSTDYFAQPSGAFNVTTALRQPGSSIKPLMYSLALEEKKYTAASGIDDTPSAFRISDTEMYKPVNYDGRYHGRVPLRYALANSYNVPAIKVLNTLGVDEFVDHARKMGITTWGDSSQYGLSLTLGGGEVKMVDMATAFGVFANAGYKVPVKNILKLTDSKNAVIESKDEKAKVLDEGVAFIISDILSDNSARIAAFGTGNQLEIPGYKVAVKTGTTDSKKDNWTIGYTRDYLVAVWVGNNDGTPMNPALTSGVTGAAPIWHRVMAYVLKNYPVESAGFQKPSDVVERACYGNRVEYFLSGTENDSGCNIFTKPSVTVTPSPDNNQQPTQAPVEIFLPQQRDIKDNRYNRGKNR